MEAEDRQPIEVTVEAVQVCGVFEKGVKHGSLLPPSIHPGHCKMKRRQQVSL